MIDSVVRGIQTLFEKKRPEGPRHLVCFFCQSPVGTPTSSRGAYCVYTCKKCGERSSFINQGKTVESTSP